jgi:alpha-galactosidase
VTDGDATFAPAAKAPLAPQVDATVTQRFEWSAGRLSLLFTVSRERPTVLSGIGAPGKVTATGTNQPLVEVIITGDGRSRNNTRFTNTGVGSRLRYVEHATSSEANIERLEIVQVDESTDG